VSGVDTYRLMANYHQFVLTGEMEELAELHLPDDDALVCGEPGQLVVRIGAYAAPVEVLVQVDRPKSVVTRWEWLSGPNYGAGTPILAGPTTLTVRLDQTTAQDGRPRTTVHLEHHGLPTEWLDDMRACWLCKLEAGDDVYPLAVRTRRR
jgi:hypothetical protein